MNNKKIIMVVDAPEIILAENETAGDALLKFYRALGWNGIDILDLCKVYTTNEVYQKLYDVMIDKCPDPVGVGMAIVNRGPSVDAHVPTGKVYLNDVWVQPDPEAEETHAMRFIFTAIREYDGARLHLLNRGTEYQPWVVAWNYDGQTKSWDWGNYSNNLSEALATFLDKYSNYGFNRINENLEDSIYGE